MAKKIKDFDSDIEFDSTHEIYFYWYLQVLQKFGYIEKFRFGKRYDLSDKVTHVAIDSRNKISQQTLLSNTFYTDDFGIIWNDKAENIFFNYIDESNNKIPISRNCFFKAQLNNKNKPYSAIDIKNPYNKKGVKAMFSIKQRWVYQMFEIYVQEVEIKHLFLQTFTPKRYTFTDKKASKRSINFKVYGIKDFIKRVT